MGIHQSNNSQIRNSQSLFQEEVSETHKREIIMQINVEIMEAIYNKILNK